PTDVPPNFFTFILIFLPAFLLFAHKITKNHSFRQVFIQLFWNEGFILNESLLLWVGGFPTAPLPSIQCQPLCRR
ncbi:MAG: hypothetical protein K2H38_01570, partial [Muribaculaceae bacterium]|nr:hypothetical protein [Muribaculaceae bacterium]